MNSLRVSILSKSTSRPAWTSAASKTAPGESRDVRLEALEIEVVTDQASELVDSIDVTLSVSEVGEEAMFDGELVATV